MVIGIDNRDDGTVTILMACRTSPVPQRSFRWIPEDQLRIYYDNPRVAFNEGDIRYIEAADRIDIDTANYFEHFLFGG